MLTVTRVIESDGANGVGTAVRAVVWWNGVVVGDYADYGNGGEGHMRVVNDPAWMEMTKAIPFSLEARIKEQIAIELKNKAMRRAIKRGMVVFQKVGEDKFLAANSGAGREGASSGKDAIMAIVRRNFPGAKFYVRLSPNGWGWIE